MAHAKYVGSAIIFITANYAERIQVHLAKWKIAAAGEEDKEKGHEEAGGGDAAKKETAAEKKQTWTGSLMGKGKTKDAANQGQEGAGAEAKGSSDRNGA